MFILIFRVFGEDVALVQKFKTWPSLIKRLNECQREYHRQGFTVLIEQE